MKKELKSFSYTFFLSVSLVKNDRMRSTFLLSENFREKNSGEPSGGFICICICEIMFGVDGGLHSAYTTL